MDWVFGGMTDEEKKEWMTKEYLQLQKVNEDDIVFAGKTAGMIAFERMLESEKSDNERLFNDHLAKHFVGPYGKRVCEMLACGLITCFDPDNEVGFLHDGHVHYTAARTRLINDHMTTWIGSLAGAKQVVELGAGFSTRPFWVETLETVTTFFEVDTRPINDSKNKVFDELRLKGSLNVPFCERKVVSMDFSRDSVSEMAQYGFNDKIPTCWILEGLVMYLSVEETSLLLRELSAISSAGSLIILNFVSNNPSSEPDMLERVLQEHGWSNDERIYFGEEKFSYGRYPVGKPVNRFMGFCFSKKI